MQDDNNTSSRSAPPKDSDAATEQTEKRLGKSSGGLSLIISALSLATSAFTLYYVNIDSRYSAHLMADRIQMTQDGAKYLSVDHTNFTFENGGNRPISIQRALFIIHCEDHRIEHIQPTDFSGDVNSFHSEDGSFYLSGPDNFAPFVVKPMEIEVKSYSFSKKLDLEIQPIKRCLDSRKRLVISLNVVAFTSGYGVNLIRENFYFSIIPDRKGEGMAGLRVNDGIVSTAIIKKHWPFY